MRWVVGLLLVGAAVLKAVQFLTEPAVALASPLSWFLVPFQIAAEASIGVSALVGLYWRQLRWLALSLFTGFAAYSLYLATSGAASCGCFGSLEVHPWWTFALDTAVVSGLLLSIFVGRDDTYLAVTPNHQGTLATTLIALSAAGAVALGWYAAPREAASLATIGDLVVLEPDQWIGKPLPIAASIDADLSKGDWIVLLHRHKCPECQEAAPRYEGLAISENVALIEMPPYGGELVGDGPALHARLRDDREWFVRTPVEIRLEDGVVISASKELPAITLAREL